MTAGQKSIQLPALCPALGIVAGILLWTATDTPWPAVGAAAAAAALTAVRRFTAGFAMLCVAIGWLSAMLHAPAEAPAAFLDGVERPWQGVVTETSSSARSTKTDVRIHSIDNRPVEPFIAEIYGTPGEELPLPGDSISACCALREAIAWSDLPGQADMSGHYLRKGIAATSFAGENSLRVTGHRNTFARATALWRSRILSLLAHSGVNDTTFAALAAIIIGHDDELPESLLDNFRASGIAHALALSGFHVGIIIMIVSFVLFPLRASFAMRTPRLLAAIALIWLYAALTGFPLSVTRAVIMATIFILSKLIGRAADPLNSLLSAVLLIAVFSPFSIFSPGLQLSVAAVGGIIAFGPVLNPVPRKRHRAFVTVATLTLPLAAMLGTMPLIVAYFHNLPLLFLFSNIMIVLLMPLWMTGGIILIALAACGAPTTGIAIALNFITAIVDRATSWMSSLPWCEIEGLYPSTYVTMAVIVIILTGAVALNRRSRLWLSVAGVVALATAVIIPATAATVDEREIIIARHQSATSVVMRHSNIAVVVSSAPARAFDNTARRIDAALEGFVATRRIDSVFHAAGDFDIAGFSRRGDIITDGTTTFAIPQRPRRGGNTAEKVDYIIIGNCFRGNIGTLLENMQCDTVLIGCEVRPGRADEIAAVCRRRGIPAVSLARKGTTR